MELQYITVGVIVNTHGLRGETRVLSRTEIPEQRFAPKSVLQVRLPNEQPRRELQVLKARQHKQFWLVTFEGIDCVEDAEKLKGLELCIPVSDLPELETGAYYIHQLVGLRVLSDAGEELGTLREVLTPGANDVYVVQRGRGQKDILIPAIKECIVDVDLSKNEMTVHLLPGLLDEE